MDCLLRFWSLKDYNLCERVQEYFNKHHRNKQKQIGKIEKLLKCDAYPGLSSDVILEAPCFQLLENGDVDRQVYIGVTSSEFVIVVRHLHDCSKFPAMKYKTDVDLDLEGLEVVGSSPLQYVRFFMIDQGARKFAVCTSLGHIWYFEMCNCPDGSDDLWTNWREIIADADDPLKFGFKTWKVRKADALDARRTVFPSKTKDVSHLNYIRRPQAFYGVDSIGLQYSVSSLENGDSKILNPQKYRPYAVKRLEKYRPFSDNAEPDTQIFPPSLNPNFSPVRSESTPDVRHDRNSCEVKVEDVPCGTEPFRSRSECVLGMSSTSFSKERSFHYKFSVISFIGEALPDEPHMAVDIVRIRFHTWGLGRTTLNQMHKIWKLRHEERLIREQNSSLQLSDSDESITDIVEEVHKEKKRKSVHDRWKMYIKKKSKKKKKSAFDEVMKTIVFQTCDINKYKEDMWMYGASSAELAAQLTQIHTDMFKKVSELDIINFFDKHNPQNLSSNLHELLSLSQGMSYLVVREILEAKTPSQLSQRLAFFLQVCEACRRSHDFQSTWAVLIGLQLLQVPALEDTWSDIGKEFPAMMSTYKRTCQMFSHMTSSEYSEELQNAVHDKNYLPWMNHFLWHMKQVLHRPFEDSQPCQEPDIDQRKTFGITSLFRRKSNTLNAPGGLVRTISSHRQEDLKRGSWMALHKDEDNFYSVNCSGGVEGFAEMLSSHIVQEGMFEFCKLDSISRATRQINETGSGKLNKSKHQKSTGCSLFKALRLKFSKREGKEQANKRQKAISTKEPKIKPMSNSKGKMKTNTIPVIQISKCEEEAATIISKNETSTRTENKGSSNSKSTKSVNVSEQSVRNKQNVQVQVVQEQSDQKETKAEIQDQQRVKTKQNRQVKMKHQQASSSSKQTHQNPQKVIPPNVQVQVQQRVETKQTHGTPQKSIPPNVQVQDQQRIETKQTHETPQDIESKPQQRVESEKTHQAHMQHQQMIGTEQTHQTPQTVIPPRVPQINVVVREARSPTPEERQVRLIPSRRLSRSSSGDGLRRKSLFEAATEDDEGLERKESAIDNAVQDQLKRTRSGSIFETWTREEEQEQLANPDLPQKKPSFLGSLFGGNASSSTNIGKNNHSSVDISRNIDSSTNKVGRQNASNDDKREERELDKGETEIKSESLDTNIQRTGSLDSMETKEQPEIHTTVNTQRPKREAFRETIEYKKRMMKSKEERRSGTSREPKIRQLEVKSSSLLKEATTTANVPMQAKEPKDNTSNKRSKKVRFANLQDKNSNSCQFEDLQQMNQNCSSSSGVRCAVCRAEGCVFSGCGLEKLIELQLACMCYHLKSNSKLYTHIKTESQNIKSEDIQKLLREKLINQGT